MQFWQALDQVIMPRYDYHCPANGKVLEVDHSWNHKLNTWEDLCCYLHLDTGETPPDSPVVRLIGTPKILRTNKFDEGEDSQSFQAAHNVDSADHPLDCSCCFFPTSPGLESFQAKLKKMIIEGNNKNE